MIQGILFGAVMATFLDSIQIDQARLTEHRVADADVIANLERHGDCATAVRSIDLHFVGSKSGVAKLSAKSSDLGVTVIQSLQTPEGETTIDLSVQSNALPASIDLLTVSALKIETYFKLRYDGWGTVVTKCESKELPTS